MAIDYEKAFKNALGFVKNKNRFGIMFLVNLFSVFILGVPFYLLFGGITSLFGVAILISFLVIFITNTFFDGLFVHNFKNPKSVGKSARFVFKIFLKLLTANAFIALGSLILALIPYAGILFVILFVFAVFFVNQEIVLKKREPFKAIRSSVNIFRSHWLYVVITFLLSTVVVTILILIFSIPILLFIGVGVTKNILLNMFIQQHLLEFIITVLILLIGFAFAKLFDIGLRTSVYLQIKRR